MAKQLALLEESPGALGAEGDVFIRSSRRARRLSLRVIPPYQIELVVPHRTPPRKVEAFLEQNRGWISRTRAELDAQYPARLKSLPSTIDLIAIGRQFEVSVQRDPSVRAALRETPQGLVLTVPSEYDRAAFELLRQWLLAQGRQHLKPWLHAEAQVLGLAPSRVQIRTQRTRWGSCSEQGSISLNAALLLLVPRLVRYLMIHELCHLEHPNHSSTYWLLVQRHDPDYRSHDRALASAWMQIPVWALPC